ncbi:hypothetical protein GCM10010260_53820 [Streptomyces filipinensis]|uniref:Uncharacterized protein n=1 Tax=Streptomyces filipinensis TaxID=66887 RepID=A0A918IF67_9ACTN|nr:hypothetical protein GCM10010260_53820 [Streptomyces filipinensis]
MGVWLGPDRGVHVLGPVVADALGYHDKTTSRLIRETGGTWSSDTPQEITQGDRQAGFLEDQRQSIGACEQTPSASSGVRCACPSGGRRFVHRL